MVPVTILLASCGTSLLVAMMSLTKKVLLHHILIGIDLKNAMVQLMTSLTLCD